MKLDFFSTLSIVLFTSNIIHYYYFINIIVIILTTSSIIIYKHYYKRDFFIILINFVLEILFNYFLIYNNPFLLFSTKLLQFIFSIHLNEIIYTNKKSANLFIPYIIWNYLLTLFTTVFLFLNVSF